MTKVTNIAFHTSGTRSLLHNGSAPHKLLARELELTWSQVICYHNMLKLVLFGDVRCIHFKHKIELGLSLVGAHRTTAVDTG